MSKLDEVRSNMAAENEAWRDRMSAVIDEIERLDRLAEKEDAT